jgi:hypothetical protein
LLEQDQAKLDAQYGVFVGLACRDDPGEACDDFCGQERADDLSPLWLADAWPACPCCGRAMQLVAPLTKN